MTLRRLAPLALSSVLLSACGDDGGEATSTADASSTGSTEASTATPTSSGPESSTEPSTTGSSTAATTDVTGTSTTDSDTEADASGTTGDVAPNRYSVQLDGVAAHVNLGSRDAIFGEGTHAVTIAVWVRLPSIPVGDELSGDGIFHVADGGGFGAGFDVFWSTEKADPSIAFYPPGLVGGLRGVPADPLSWTHVVVTFDPDGALPNAKLYLDGALATEGDAMGGTFDAPGEVWVGKYLNDGFATEGWFDEVAVWSEALGADEITAMYGGGSPLDLLGTSDGYASADALLGYWRMGDDDGGAGTTVSDATANSDGTLLSGAAFVEEAP